MTRRGGRGADTDEETGRQVSGRVDLSLMEPEEIEAAMDAELAALEGVADDAAQAASQTPADPVQADPADPCACSSLLGENWAEIAIRKGPAGGLAAGRIEPSAVGRIDMRVGERDWVLCVWDSSV